MSFVITRPEALATAAGHLSGVGSGLTATQFSAHAALYQAVSAQETTVHEMFTRFWAPLLRPMRLSKPAKPSQLCNGRSER
jgi:hypothetical protein